MHEDESEHIEQLASKLRDYDFRDDIMDTDSYNKAYDEIVRIGEPAVPVLLKHLGSSLYIALALGKIGNQAALNALSQELRAPDWRRVEAAARGLGVSKNPNAISILEAVRGSGYDLRVAEVHQAFNWALGELEKAQAGAKWLEVDRKRPWQQITMVQQQLDELRRDETKRQQAISWWKEFTKAMPEMVIKVPGYDLSADDAKARAWSGLAVTIYYLLNPSDSMFHRPCPEARFCWEQALKLQPGDEYFTDCLHRVS